MVRKQFLPHVLLVLAGAGTFSFGILLYEKDSAAIRKNLVESLVQAFLLQGIKSWARQGFKSFFEKHARRVTSLNYFTSSAAKFSSV